MFSAQPRLAVAAMFSILGLSLFGLGVFVFQRGLLFLIDGFYDAFTLSMAAAGLVMIIVGGRCLAAGIRSFELFERRLLTAISSRGRLQD